MRVPVLDLNKKPLMPCSPQRANALLRRGEAKKYWQKGIFCIMMIREPSARNYQPIALGVDPGSKREGYTVITEKKVILNITTNTPDWVKKHLETRRNLRRSRRQRKTPYRKMRPNRAVLKRFGRIPPSTLARWNAKLRVISLLTRIIPITHINIEDIKAISKEGKKKWNLSFSPLEVGKTYFYNKIKFLYPNIELKLTDGLDTKKHRDIRGFKKSKNKLDYIWETHNVDSHSLAEMSLNIQIKPDYKMYRIRFLEYYRRKLHEECPKKGGFRREYGSTVSEGMSRGSVVRYNDKLYYLGGSSKGRVSIHDIGTGKRINQNAKVKDLKTMYMSKFATISPS